jgi:hypothetical protein
MRKFMSLRQPAWALALFVSLGIFGCKSLGTSARNLAIEGALSQGLGYIEIPNGPGVRITNNRVRDILERAESAGLITRSRSANGDGNYEVIGTTKLLGLAIDPKKVWTAEASRDFVGGEAGDPTEYSVLIYARQAKIERTITDEEYKGPLASPGEKHRLILGTFRISPSPAAAAMGIDLSTPEKMALRFRCVVKYSEFKKEWSVVGLDLGSIDPEQWYSSHVM